MSEMFSVQDLVAEQWLEPFFAPTVDAAIRSFKEACTRPDHQFAKFPEDYVLYRVGTFDGRSGEVIGEGPAKIAMASSFKTVPVLDFSSKEAQ